MKKVLLSTVAALSVLSGAALAADLPYRQAAPAPAFVAVPVFTWTGLYLGGNAGYGFSQGNATTAGLTPFAQGAINAGAIAHGAKIEPDGFVGGGQIGYNWQVGSVVLGLETDIQYTGFKKTVGYQALGFDTSSRSTTDYLGTVRGRVGYAFDRWMIYATGGLAYGNVFNSHSVSAIGGVAPLTYGAKDDMKTGYTVGGGIEYAMPVFNFGASAATVKLEYLYYDLGDRTVTSLNGNGTPIFATKFQNDGHIVRAGLNWKFGGF
ncbi:outer membrane protein [Enterovirga rhinocerotis]|uniref:Outer membrane immunogenic protein n=1 Tax=Enterovirga rhinocerotis TaxID=1339210 RepID=A0A4R7BW27_9HYPH|nr:porin family protein [Enterovirga rhinocerotis]TDR89312.1 outer membrane immunogenic protein [Enterovirga rhinocerotis]